MRRQPLQRRPKLGITDPLSRRTDRLSRRSRQIPRMTNGTPMYCRRLYLQLQSGEIRKLFERHQLPLQPLLLITQTRRPVPVGDNQQERTFTPRSHMTVLACRGLQLAFQQTL
ncbi:hypothetical protein SAMN05216605_1122 [Pseudomonas abietaniphila]|uniref:Uncharacterized protein n=1 Tax=Pseudomonas abietaniphila TaxID=89065 RepID=A0A1G8JAY6_9PSED|nr:hypothetical protein SAMN05216605_1122 [Pseudomonas abietaniphila]